MAHFELLPPRRLGRDLGGVASLVIHVALIVPVVVQHAITPEANDPVDQFVVFLVPPEKEGGQASAGRGVDWSGLVGSNGVVDEPVPVERKVETALPIGPAGDSVPTVEEAPAAPPQEETAMTEIEVDSTVVRDPSSAAPVYPPPLLADRIEGSTFVHYVVDTTGKVDVSTIQIVRSTHPGFAESVREALAVMKFRPAVQGARRVRQWVQQNFAFRIVTPAPAVKDST
ncbi:MAG: TonB family protein [Gemmatimonadales bacterium]|nr:TonB family protein [Gemmatimonadota bacterium]MDX2056810.1 TonB family protein [Gemmatimonadales bacterium]